MYQLGLDEAGLAIPASLSLCETACSQGHDNFQEVTEIFYSNRRTCLMSSIHHGPRTLYNDFVLS